MMKRIMFVAIHNTPTMVINYRGDSVAHNTMYFEIENETCGFQFSKFRNDRGMIVVVVVLHDGLIYLILQYLNTQLIFYNELEYKQTICRP